MCSQGISLSSCLSALSLCFALLMTRLVAAETRLPVPGQGEQGRIEKALKRSFKDGFALREPKEKLAFAGKLLQLAEASKKENPRRYVLFRKAAQIAAGTGGVELAMKAVEGIVRNYEVQDLNEKLDILAVAVKNAKGVPTMAAATRMYLRLVDACFDKEEYDLARQAAKAANATAQKARNSCLRELAKETKKDVEEIRRKYKSDAILTAKRTLEKTPDDSEANLAVGRFYCFTQGSWDKGLDYLAKTLTVGITPAAKRDRANPRLHAEQLTVADDWSNLAQKERGLDRKHLEQRASYWYERALPGLSDLRKVEVERKLRTLARQADPCIFRDAVLLMSFEKETFFEKDGRIYVKDLSGTKNHGLVQGAKIVEGRIGSALSFDGTDDHVDCGNAPSLNFPTGMSISAWVSPASLAGRSSDYIVSKDDWRQAIRGFVLRIGSSGTAGLTVSASGWRTVRGTTTIESNRWYHIAATSDGKELRIYVDGAMKSSAVIPRAIIPSPSPLRIGAGYFDPGRRFHGLIDEVAIFDRALDPTEIWFLYRYGMQGKPLRN